MTFWAVLGVILKRIGFVISKTVGRGASLIFASIEKIGFFNVIALFFFISFLTPAIIASIATKNAGVLLGEIGYRLVLSDVEIKLLVTSLETQMSKITIWKTIFSIIGQLWLFVWVIKLIRLYIRKATSGFISEGVGVYLLLIPALYAIPLIGLLIGALTGVEGVTFITGTKEYLGVAIKTFKLSPMPYEGILLIITQFPMILDAIGRAIPFVSTSEHVEALKNATGAMNESN